MRRLITLMLASALSITVFASVATHLQRRPAFGVGHRLALVVMVSVPDSPPNEVAIPSPTSPDISPQSLPQRSWFAEPSEPAAVVEPFGYLPAHRLTTRPLIQTDIDAILPATFYGIAPQRLVLQLLINQYGDVDRVVVEESALPQVLLAELQAKFLQARFTPGRLDTRAVSSAVRIEVQLQ
jgi:hypothetical protein